MSGGIPSVTKGFLGGWTDWWAPSTDARVLAQAIVLTLILGAAGVAVRRDSALLTLVVGIATMTAGLFLLRAVH